MGIRKEQAEQTKQAIMAAFLELIQEKSLAEIKISDITAKANVSVGTYYYHFKEKSECIKEIIYSIDRKLREKLLIMEKQTLKADLLLYINRLCFEYEDELGLNAAVNVNQCQMQFESDFFMKVDSPVNNHIYAILDAHKKSECADEVIEELTLYLGNIIRGTVYSWCLLRGKMNLQQTLWDIVNSYMKEEPKFIYFSL